MHNSLSHDEPARRLRQQAATIPFMNSALARVTIKKKIEQAATSLVALQCSIDIQCRTRNIIVQQHGKSVDTLSHSGASMRQYIRKN